MNLTLSLSRSARAWLESSRPAEFLAAWNACEYVSTFPTGCSLVRTPAQLAHALLDALPAPMRPEAAITVCHASAWPLSAGTEDVSEFSFAQ